VVPRITADVVDGVAGRASGRSPRPRNPLLRTHVSTSGRRRVLLLGHALRVDLPCGAIDDHVGFVGEVDEFIDWAFAYHGTQTRYQHYLLNHTAEIAGDTAHAETYYLFAGTDREPANHVTNSGGRYVDRLERRDVRWAIVARVCVVEWITESTSSITEEVIGMLSAVQTPTKDRSDPSYLRPLVVASH
jgi:hypothetical protein